VHPGLIFVQPRTGFQVASVHSICEFSAIRSDPFRPSIALIYLLQIFRVLRTLYLMSEHRKGDKVRIKGGRFTGQRGTLLRAHSGRWTVILAEQNLTALVPTEEVTNYSLAARRAWRSMPDRKVGRPTGSKVSDRVSVIFRVDRTLWDDFVRAEENGVISDRTMMINQCLRDLLAGVRMRQPKAS
jgi:hypothetical protein